jgi:hypothetical protein
MSLIGALRQYGILEGSGTALRISDDAVAYYVRDDGPEKTEAMRRMVYKPAFFEELRAEFPGGLPSEGNLIHKLVTKGFSEDAAEEVIRVYKANVELVDGTDGEYNKAEETPAVTPVTPATTSTPKPIVPPPAGSHAWTWTLSVPRQVNAQLSIIGEVTKQDIERLKKQIEFLAESFEDEQDE